MRNVSDRFRHVCQLTAILLTQSALNRRLRHLWGAFILLQNAVAEALARAGDYDVLDGFPSPVAHGAHVDIVITPADLIPELQAELERWDKASMVVTFPLAW